MRYFKKMKGTPQSPPAVGLFEIAWSWIGSFIGVAAYRILDHHLWLAAAVAVATAIAAMHVTKTLHPPGGATALIAVIGGDGIHDLGSLYVLVPVGLGALMMLAVALMVNNIPKN